MTGSSTPYRQVVSDVCPSDDIAASTSASTAEGLSSTRAQARTAARSCPMTAAAPMPRPMTSPMTSPTRPRVSGTRSYQSPPTSAPGRAGQVAVRDGQPGQLGQRARQQRALQRQRGLALLPVAQGVVDGGGHAVRQVLDELDVGLVVGGPAVAGDVSTPIARPPTASGTASALPEAEPPAARRGASRRGRWRRSTGVGEGPVVHQPPLADGLADAGAAVEVERVAHEQLLQQVLQRRGRGGAR